mgnify:CR=1 FL=1
MYEIIYPAAVAGLTAAVYGGYGYLTGKFGGSAADFESEKLIGTILVGAAVGATASMMGMEVTEASVVGIMATIGAVEVSQKLLKPVFNWFRDLWNKPLVP